jgi:streptogramin lyase
VPGDALGIAVVGDSVWATSFDEYRCNKTCFSRLSRIDTRSNRVTGKFNVPTPTGMAFGDGSLWIVNHRAATVTRFDPRKAKVLATIRVRIGHESIFEGPERIATGLGGVWVSHPVQDVVTRIDPRTNKVVARIRFPNGSLPVYLALGAGSVWAVGAKQIFRIDPRRNRVIDAASIGTHRGSDYRGLRQVLVSGNTLWVSDGDADTVDRVALGPKKVPVSTRGR